MTPKHDETETARSDSTSIVDEFDREAVFETVDSTTLETVVKLVLSVGALLVLLGIVSVLPGVDRAIPATPITIAALAVALVTAATVSVFVYAAPRVERLVEQATGGDEQLAPEAGAVAKYLVILAGVLVAYRGFAGVVVPFLAPSGTVWLYDFAFLGVALAPTALVGLALYRALDPAAEEITRVLVPSEDETTSGTDAVAESGSDADEAT